MYNEKDKQKQLFQYVPAITNEGGCKCGSS